ncbi:MAG: SPOR domain-containing protein [Ignavibacteriaceae bacterium]
MTKAELIRKLARKAGAPDSEAKIFFEIFLRKASEILKLGEAIKLKSFGYFQFRRGMIKNISSSAGSIKNLAYADLMVFTPLNESEEANENLIFNIPSSRDEEFHYVDLYFSLSIGKPVIPLKGVIDTEFFVPPTGIELRKLIQIKVDKLLLDVEVIDQHIKGSEFLLIDAKKSNLEQFEFNWENVYSENLEFTWKNNSSKQQTLPGENSEMEHVAWDFGKDLSRQIEEEVLLDTTKDSEDVLNYDIDSSTGIEWNFGRPVSEGEEESEPEFERVETLSASFNNKSFAESSRDDDSINDLFSTKEFDARVAEDLNNFDRVKSVTSELNETAAGFGITKSENDLSWNFGNITSEINHENNFKEDEKSFLGKVDELDDKNTGSDLSTIEIEKDNISKTEEIFEKEKNIQPVSTGDFHYTSEIAKTNTGNSSSVRARSSLVFFVALTVILFIGVLLFAVVSKFNFMSLLSGNKILTPTGNSNSQPVVIERDYHVPVNYPYAKKDLPGDLAGQGIDPTALNNQKIHASNQTQPAKSNLSALLNSSDKKENSAQTIFPSGKNSKVKENIFGAAGNYSVQVSSWKSKIIAGKEVEKFKRKGFASTLEKAELPGRGVWYRVKVGGFKSLTDAEKFLANNK